MKRWDLGMKNLYSGFRLADVTIKDLCELQKYKRILSGLPDNGTGGIFGDDHTEGYRSGTGSVGEAGTGRWKERTGKIVVWILQ